MAHKTDDKTCFNPKIASGIALWLVLLAVAVELLGAWLGDGSSNPVLTTLDLTRPDLWMIVVGGVLFLIFWGLSEKFLFGPYLEVFHAREEATTKAESSADSVNRRAANLMTDYEEQLKNGRIEAMRVKLEKLAEAKQEADAIISGAEERAQDQVAQARESLTKKRQELRDSALNEVDGMAKEVFAKLMQPSREVKRSIH